MEDHVAEWQSTVERILAMLDSHHTFCYTDTMMTATKLTTSHDTHLAALYARMQTAKQVTDAFQSGDNIFRHVDSQLLSEKRISFQSVMPRPHGRDTIPYIVHPIVKVNAVFRWDSLPYVVGQTAHAQDLLNYIRHKMGRAIGKTVRGHDQGIHDDVASTFLRMNRYRQDYLHIGQERLHVAATAFLLWLDLQNTARRTLRQISDQWSTITATQNIPKALASRIFALHVVQALQAVSAKNESIDESVPTEWRVPLWEEAYREVFENVDYLQHTVRIMQTVYTKYEQGQQISHPKRPWWTLTAHLKSASEMRTG